MPRAASQRSEGNPRLSLSTTHNVVPDEVEEGMPSTLTDPLIDHPEYYGGAGNPYEAIEVIKAWIGDDATLGFCVGNTLKYICRAGRKEPDSMHSLKQDLMKARWYLDAAIGLLPEE